MDTPNYQPDEIDHATTKPINQIEDVFERNPIDETDAIDDIDEIEDLFLAACSQEGIYVDDPGEDVWVSDESSFGNKSGWIRSQGQPFSRILYDLLKDLVLWSETCPVGRNHGAFRALMNEVGTSIQRVVDVYLLAIPMAVQALFESENWSFDDLMSLRDANAIRSRGVYLHVFQREYQGRLREMAYVGYSQCINNRLEGHETIIAKGKLEGRLPKLYCQSRHYQHAVHANDSSSYKTLAIVDDTLDTRLLILLESVFMILFQTVRYPGYTTTYNLMESYDSLGRLSQTLGIVSPLFGLNMTLSVFQAMPHPWSHLDLPCISCQEMTYPSHHLPTKTTRRPFDSKDPSKGYICDPCRRFKRSHNRLPTREEINEQRGQALHLQEGSSHTSCEICDDIFSEIVTESEGYIHRRHIDGKWCCNPCYKYFESHERFPTAEEIKARKNRRTAKEATQCGECGCDLTGARYKRFQDGKWCCDWCGKFFRDKKRFPSAEERALHELNANMRSAKLCQCCHIPFTKLTRRRFVIDKKKCCANCKDFHKLHKRFRNNEEVKLHQNHHRRKQSKLTSA